MLLKIIVALSMVYPPFPRKRGFSGTVRTIWYRVLQQDKYPWSLCSGRPNSGPVDRYNEATRRCGGTISFCLLGALGPTNSGTVALQGIEITQDVGWRAVENEIFRREAGKRLQS